MNIVNYESYVYPAATSTARALIRYIIDMMNREPERIFTLLSVEERLLPLCLTFGRMSSEKRLLGCGCGFLGGRTLRIRQRLGQ